MSAVAGQANAQTWRPLPSLPAAIRRADAAQIVGVGDQIVVASLAGGNRPKIQLHSYERGRWHRPAGKALNADPRTAFKLIAYRGGCVIRTYRGSTSMRCLDANGNASGSVIGNTRSDAGQLDDAFVVDGRPFVAWSSAKPSQTGVSGAPGPRKTSVMTTNGEPWQVQMRDLASSDGGTQRARGVAGAQRTCVALDRLSSPSGPRFNQVRVVCSSARGWAYAGPALSGDATTLFGVSGATSIADSLFVGVNEFSDAGVNWVVHRLTRGVWQSLAVGAELPEWDEQGELFNFGSKLWLLEFSQQTRGRANVGRVTVKRAGPADRRASQVGEPLLDDSTMFGPISYGLAAAGDDVFALISEPKKSIRRNTISIQKLESNGG